MSKQDKVRILLVDDHQIVIDGIKNLLRKSEDVWVIGECLDGQEALEFLAQREVDLLITDLQMPRMSGLELTQKARERFPSLKILVLSMHNEPKVVQQIFQAQADSTYMPMCSLDPVRS